VKNHCPSCKKKYQYAACMGGEVVCGCPEPVDPRTVNCRDCKGRGYNTTLFVDARMHGQDLVERYWDMVCTSCRGRELADPNEADPLISIDDSTDLC
jgi:hypothetical protein